MTHQEDYNPSTEAIDLLTKNGWGAIPDLIRIMINQAMAEERAR